MIVLVEGEYHVLIFCQAQVQVHSRPNSGPFKFI